MPDETGFEGRILHPDRCTLGEGAAYDPATDTAYWFDIIERKLYEHDMANDQTLVHELPFMASVLAVVDGDRQLIAAEDGLYLRQRIGGRLTLHTPLEADNDTTRSNDGRVHPCGALWIGTMGKQAEEKAGAIYWFFKGEIRLLFPEIGIPNAISFSPDGRLAYFADTQADTVFRAELDPKTGRPIGQPSVFLAPGHDAGEPDGAVVDRDGVLWSARWGGGRITAFSPDGGKLKSIRVPASQPTCPAFVGTDGGRMLVTTATQGLDEAKRSAEPDAGKTLLLDLPLKGRFDPRVLI